MFTTISPLDASAFHERGAIMDVSPRAHCLASQGFADGRLLTDARRKFGERVVGVTIKYPRPVKPVMSPILSEGAQEALLLGVFSLSGELLVGGFTDLGEARAAARGIVLSDRFKTVTIPNYSVLVKTYVGLPDVFAGFPMTTANVTLLMSEEATSEQGKVSTVATLHIGDKFVVEKKAFYVAPKNAVVTENTATEDKAIVRTGVKSGAALVQFGLISGRVPALKAGESHGFLDRTLMFLVETLV